MVAASFWSLLAPAIELAESSGLYGSDGRYAFVPVAVGFLFGAIFVYMTDIVITYLGINSASMMIQLTHSSKDKATLRSMSARWSTASRMQWSAHSTNIHLPSAWTASPIASTISIVVSRRGSVRRRVEPMIMRRPMLIRKSTCKID